MPECPPSAWSEVDPTQWGGVVPILGGADTGKSTAVRHFYDRLRASNRSVAVIDGDPGQSTLGPPTTLTAVPPAGTSSFPPKGPPRHWFVGAPSPRGHMLEMVVGARRLLDVVQGSGPDVVLYDTTGFIEVRRGGRALKLALIDVLRPSTVVGLQRTDELEPLLTPLRQRSALQVVDLPVPSAVTRRSAEQRRDHRSRRFATYFDDADRQTLYWPDFAVRPNLDFSINELVALTTTDGFVEALARVDVIDRSAYTLEVETPAISPTALKEIRRGDVCLDPTTYEDRHP